MPVFLQNKNQVITNQDAQKLWAATMDYTHHADDEVVVRFVSEEESQRLNKEYGKKDAPTNVLTFSYGEGNHDIALCLALAEREAKGRAVTIREYAALLLVHAFLHATGMDHERSKAEAQATGRAEREILQKAGFSPVNL